MDFPRSAPLASRFESLDECGSTNTELVARAADAWPDFSVLVTTNQTAGRGRLDRVWVAPPGQSLAVSVLLRPAFGLDAFGWLPLIAGLAMARAVDAVLPELSVLPELTTLPGLTTLPEPTTLPGLVEGRVALKWPNDVQIGGLKVSGLLAELLPTADGVVLGAGLNLTIPADRLPTPHATSLTLNGADPDGLVDRSLSAYLHELTKLYRLVTEHGGDADVSGIRRLVVERCSTIGQEIRVELPGGVSRFGRATGIDETGRLVFVDREDARIQTVAAGDVTHLRYE